MHVAKTEDGIGGKDEEERMESITGEVLQQNIDINGVFCLKAAGNSIQAFHGVPVRDPSCQDPTIFLSPLLERGHIDQLTGGVAIENYQMALEIRRRANMSPARERDAEEQQCCCMRAHYEPILGGFSEAVATASREDIKNCIDANVRVADLSSLGLGSGVDVDKMAEELVALVAARLPQAKSEEGGGGEEGVGERKE